MPGGAAGSHGRPFQLRMRLFPRRLPGEDEDAFKKREEKAQQQERPFYDHILAPGTAVIMTLEANLLTQHSVPVLDEAGPSGSIVFRTITEVVKPQQLKRTKRTPESASAKRRRK